MSATLYALVMLQGTTLSFSPGYASPTECYSVYKGPFVSCFTYNPDGLSWTAFFKLRAFLQRVGSYPRSFAAL
jgi:hypothetical protein